MILLIDNYDSFTYNVSQALGSLGREVMVARNDALTLADVRSLAPEALVISPGPGRPEDAGFTPELIKTFAGQTPILGICLGHQALAQAFGAQVVRAEKPVHGKCSEVFHDGKGLFRGVRNPFEAARYHSLAVPEQSVKPPLKVSAYTLEGEVMGIRAEGMMAEGVQFHPESIATGQGLKIFSNFLETYLTSRGGEKAA